MDAAQRPPVTLFIGIAVVLLLLGASAYALYAWLGKGGLPFLSSGALSGTLILYTPVQWTTPSGESLMGFISYDLATGGATYLVPPNDPRFSQLLFDSVSLDGKEVLAGMPESTAFDSKRQLWALSLATREPTRPVDLEASGVFSNAVWSPTGSNIAFLGGFSAENTEVTLRVAPRFDDQPDFGSDVPLAFSLDGTKLLAKEAFALIIMTLYDGFRTPVTGFENSAELVSSSEFAASPDGAYLAVLKGGETDIYALDWEHATVRMIGSAESAGIPVFSSDGHMLLRTEEGTVRAYTLGERVRQAGTVKLELPMSARLIRWIK